MSVNNLTPLELVTHLFSCMQIADNQIDWEEKEVWADTLTELFPDHTPDRAQEICKQRTRLFFHWITMGEKTI